MNKKNIKLAADEIVGTKPLILSKEEIEKLNYKINKYLLLLLKNNK